MSTKGLSMMKILAMCLCLFLVSCATKSEQMKIDKEVAQEVNVFDGKTFGQSIGEAVASSKTLTEIQKKQIDALFVKTRSNNKILLEESFKLKSILVKAVLAGEGNTKEVKLIKKDLKKTEASRLNTTLAAVDELSKIVGNDPDREKFAKQLMLIDHIRY